VRGRAALKVWLRNALVERIAFHVRFRELSGRRPGPAEVMHEVRMGLQNAMSGPILTSLSEPELRMHMEVAMEVVAELSAEAEG